MKKSVLIAMVLALVNHTAFANIFRIGYPGTALTGVDFVYTNITGAMNAASAGDTIQLYQQYWPASPAAINVTKPINFIGFGYRLDKNSGLQYNNSPDVNVLTINFNSGSGGSMIMGAFIQPTINVSNIAIKRCLIRNCVINNSSSLSYITILQSNLYGDCYLCTTYALQEASSASITNLYINNNIINSNSVDLPHSSGVFANNIVLASNAPILYSFIVKNNIFSTPCLSHNSNTFNHNLFSCNVSYSAPDTPNTFSVNMNNVFANWNSGNISTESQLVLKTGSPAIGAGIKNNSTVTDAGIFGGESGEIYKLSGIPSVPSIYQISAPPAATTNPFNITVSIRGNN